MILSPVGLVVLILLTVSRAGTGTLAAQTEVLVNNELAGARVGSSGDSKANDDS